MQMKVDSGFARKARGTDLQMEARVCGVYKCVYSILRFNGVFEPAFNITLHVRRYAINMQGGGLPHALCLSIILYPMLCSLRIVCCPKTRSACPVARPPHPSFSSPRMPMAQCNLAAGLVGTHRRSVTSSWLGSSRGSILVQLPFSRSS